ncbi:MAG: LVIVD repeat-containing protein [Actinomycetota bacterium]
MERPRRRIGGLVASVALAAGGLIPPSVSAGPSQGGFSSDNVEWVAHIPFQVGTATGAKVVGKYLYVTSWREFSIYDLSDPLDPELLSTTPFGFKFENEDVATNGEIMLFSETIPQQILHIWNIEDKSNPVEIGQLGEGAGDHTTECILDCKFGYGSEGSVSDLRNPAKPKLLGNYFEDQPGGTDDAHDVNEVAPGRVLTSSQPILLLDARENQVHPKVLAVADDEKITGGIHSNRWPNEGKDSIVLFSSESNATGRCGEDNGDFMTWDGSDWKKSHSLKLLDIYELSNGVWADGAPGVNGLGCSAHWFQEHPAFRNGGLVALGSYEHGTRFVDIAPTGKIKEIGWFVPHAGSTSAAYWMTDRLVYAVDYSRGIDILRYTGKF